jgi:hypothetical protein
MPFQEVTHDQLTAALAPRNDLQRCAILFHWNDCGPCKRTLPQFQQAGTSLESIQCYSIERTEARKGAPVSLLKQFGLVKPTWPTIVWWDKYDTRCYPFPQGTPRTTPFLKSWMEERDTASVKAHAGASSDAAASAAQ